MAWGRCRLASEPAQRELFAHPSAGENGIVVTEAHSKPNVLPADSRLSGLIVDWGGVLTSNVAETMVAWASTEKVDLREFGAMMREWLGREGEVESWINPVHALERGEMEVPDFERKLADGLTSRLGHPVAAEGLLGRLFENFEHAHDMTGLVRRAKDAGIRTALLSNSWGNSYPEAVFDGMFDVVVISGDVGMRKPEPRIYEYTLAQLQLPASTCVFVDDTRANVTAAADLGLVGVLHESYQQSASELDVLFGVRLSS